MVSNKMVLVFDDEFDIVALLKQSLQRHGYHVFGFTDLLLALEHFMRNSKGYSLVISDVRMPAMSRFEFVKKQEKYFRQLRSFLCQHLTLMTASIQRSCHL
jgi:DNA-binding NtrC family response regulator